ncbi:hypothetical protein [Saccharothrix australiensis]|uniref:Uncharacterized protein n=1 Tax=Saccharothrix australiensis TaxID=2072 RepID=A0A495W7A9_9PSEU|nr:hypothetical protein [Saccharothrix australiensis]RKT56970.1 hypothetical protein C8E97_5684 [Saccharothrix australiensis]
MDVRAEPARGSRALDLETVVRDVSGRSAQVGDRAGDIAVVDIVTARERGAESGVAAVVAFQGVDDESQDDEYDQRCEHGRNYATDEILPPLAVVSLFVKILPVRLPPCSPQSPCR